MITWKSSWVGEKHFEVTIEYSSCSSELWHCSSDRWTVFNLFGSTNQSRSSHPLFFGHSVSVSFLKCQHDLSHVKQTWKAFVYYVNLHFLTSASSCLPFCEGSTYRGAGYTNVNLMLFTVHVCSASARVRTIGRQFFLSRVCFPTLTSWSVENPIKRPRSCSLYFSDASQKSDNSWISSWSFNESLWPQEK